MTLEKRSGWFVNYQDMDGHPGDRKLADRIKLFIASDFVGASVLDLGCNVGQFSRQSLEWGARSVIGIDYDRDAIKKAREITPNASFSVEDLDLPCFWRSVPKCDLVLLLSIYLTKELANKEAILSNATAKCRRVMYFEGHANETQGYRVQEYVRDICQYTDFENIEYLGQTDAPGLRPLFRCSRGALGMIDAAHKLIEASAKYKKIAVVGKSAAGKTALCYRVRQLMDDGNSTFTYDDIPPPYNSEKFILFDWRGLEYVPDADCVFFVVCDESERQKRIDAVPVKDRLLRTSPGVPTNARAIYTVRL